MDNDELLGAVEWEGGWAELITHGFDADSLTDPVVKEKFKEAVDRFKDFTRVTDELDQLLGNEGY